MLAGIEKLVSEPLQLMREIVRRLDRIIALLEAMALRDRSMSRRPN